MTEPLFAYQEQGAAYLAAQDRALLCDEPGLGKTVQAIRAAERACLPGEVILVLAPASVAANWVLEWHRWGEQGRAVRMLRTAGDVGRLVLGAAAVVSYDTAKTPTVRNALLARRWGALICDEAHFIKSPGTARTRLVLGDRVDGGPDSLVSVAKRAWGLTGTPMPNTADELWSLFKAFRPAAVENDGKPVSYASWRRAFCVEIPIPGRHGASKIVGIRNEDDLRRRVQGAMLRRRVNDVLKDLPALRVAEIGLDPALWERALSDGLLTAETRAVLREAQRLAAEPDRVLDLLTRDSAGEIARVRRLVGALKAAALGPLLAEEMEQHREKLVVFGWHREALSAIESALARFGTVRVDGSTPAQHRGNIVRSFQEDPGVRVFIGQIQAAGTGLTLTAANQLVFAEHSWVPSDNAQAAKRIHRIGQTRPVLIRHAVLAGTPDQAVIRALRRKTQGILATIGE